MQDYKVTVKIQQGRLLKAIENAGIASMSELARLVGTNPSIISDLVNFKLSPRTKEGGWRKPVVAICVLLNTQPSDLFPESMQIVKKSNSSAAYLSMEQIRSIALPMERSPTIGIEFNEDLKNITDELGLSDREMNILEGCIMGTTSYKDMGERIGVCGARIGSIKERILRKLRRGRNRDALEDYFTDGVEA